MSEAAKQIRGGGRCTGPRRAVAITFLTGIVFCKLVFGQTAGAKTPGGPVCPLSDEQTRKSIEAFAKIAKFITTEPRCVNCHGGVNPHIDGIGEDPEQPDAPPSLVDHGGGKQDVERFSDGERHIPVGCKDCHNNMARKRDGSESRWMTAPNILAFVGKDATTLCKQIRRQSDDAKDFIGHLIDDNGGNNFATTAFNGNMGLGGKGLSRDKPSISHDAFIKMGQDWVDAQGGEFKGDTECGCVPSHYSIRLTTQVEHRMGPISGKGGMQVDIPITFADDGSFSGLGMATIRGQGTAYEIQGQSRGELLVLASGHATETAKEHSMHLQLDEGSPFTVNGTVTLRGRSFSGGSSQSGNGASPAFDLKGDVGEFIDKPYFQLPGLVATMHLEIVKRDEKKK